MDDEIRKEIYELHARLCKALADPKRLLLLESLRLGPATVGELANGIGISQSNVSQHLALLRDRGIVHSERAGNNVLYSLSNPKVLKAVDILREVMTETIARREEIHRAAVAGEHR
ncbi:MAG: helix-turn-helix transcriptional regulator [Actinobacteria bacterium]|nr:MAG: helix-turn-helix transcriptional regulator [Actinomycetota bacterium]